MAQRRPFGCAKWKWEGCKWIAIMIVVIYELHTELPNQRGRPRQHRRSLSKARTISEPYFGNLLEDHKKWLKTSKKFNFQTAPSTQLSPSLRVCRWTRRIGGTKKFNRKALPLKNLGQGFVTLFPKKIVSFAAGQRSSLFYWIQWIAFSDDSF